GPYVVNQDLALLIHQPGLPITTFPNTFTYSGLVGASDAEHIPSRSMLLMTRNPMPNRPPTNDASQPAQSNTGGCGCSGVGVSSPSTGRATGTIAQVALYIGASTLQVTDLLGIVGRGFSWFQTRTYRNDVSVNGP